MLARGKAWFWAVNRVPMALRRELTRTSGSLPAAITVCAPERQRAGASTLVACRPWQGWSPFRPLFPRAAARRPAPSVPALPPGCGGDRPVYSPCWSVRMINSRLRRDGHQRGKRVVVADRISSVTTVSFFVDVTGMIPSRAGSAKVERASSSAACRRIGCVRSTCAVCRPC